MVIFIDESGTDKQIGHTSIVFVYLEVKNVEKFNRLVGKIEKEVGIDFFHWSHERWDNRISFIEKLQDVDFSFKVCKLLNPTKLSQKFEHVMLHFIVEPNIDQIIIDGQKPKWYSSKIKLTLRQHGTTVKKLRMGNDRSYPGLRVADSLAGLMRSYYDNPENELASRLVKKISKGKVIYEATLNN